MGRKPDIYRILYVIIDIFVINISSILAMLLRFNLSFAEIEKQYLESVTSLMLVNTIATIIIFAALRLYTTLWRFASIKELVYIIEACTASLLFNILLYYLTYSPIFRSYFIIYPASLFLLTCTTRFAYRLIRLLYRGQVHGSHMRHTMIIGAGEACNVVMKELELSTELDAHIRCIIDDDVRKHGTYIHGVKVVGGRDKILYYAERYHITEMIIAIPSMSKKEMQKLLQICQQWDCELKILPGVYQLVNGEVTVEKLRSVNIEDLLGREPIQIRSETIGRYVSGKTVLVTGGGGSIGSELCRQIAANGVQQLIIFDIYENNAYEIQQELKRKYPDLDMVVLIGSVRNTNRLDYLFRTYRPDIVYHAAAHKHVPLMEDSPNEAIKNNVLGTYKTARAAIKYKAQRFILISTDKAVNPTNIMGASKRLCEMVVQMSNQKSSTEFVAVRFGNVLGSNGSVIPLFKQQIESGGPVTVTHKDIIRYFMTIPEAVSLVIQAGAYAKGGEIFVLNMGNPVRILDMAENLIRLSGYEPYKDIDICFTGLRPGEKLYEELLMDEEGLQKTVNDRIFIGKPIDMDYDRFERALQRLGEAALSETANMRELVHDLVPEYHYRNKNTEAVDMEAAVSLEPAVKGLMNDKLIWHDKVAIYKNGIENNR